MPHRDVEKYKDRITVMNNVGMKKLRNYCTTKKHPVRNFDRDIKIIRKIMVHGYAGCVCEFGISRQRAEQIFLRYTEYAQEANKAERAKLCVK